MESSTITEKSSEPDKIEFTKAGAAALKRHLDLCASREGEDIIGIFMMDGLWKLLPDDQLVNLAKKFQ